LAQKIDGMITYGCKLGYEGPLERITTNNLSTAQLDPESMTQMLEADLQLKRVSRSTGEFPFISSPLGFVPKPNGKLRRIHHLSHPRKSGTNAGIAKEYGYLQYVRIYDVCAHILAAGRGSFIMKRDWEAAFRNIAVSPQDQWLLGFRWKGVFYKECCLPFGLRTAPFLFNLFAEALQWILQSWLGWTLVCHYLDDIIHVFSVCEAHLQESKALDYTTITNLLGVPRNNDKDAIGQVVTVFGYELDTLLFEMRIPLEKLLAITQLINNALQKRAMTLLEVQTLAGYLSWVAPAIQLGWVFCRKLWDFQGQFTAGRSQQHLTIPSLVRSDLEWWSTCIETHNGTRFFDDPSRTLFHLFTDACGQGMGGFFYKDGTPDWKANIQRTLPANAFAMAIPPNDLMDPLDINIFEVRATVIALQHWGHLFAHQRLVLSTDNKATFHGITKGTLNSSANNDLREFMCLAAKLDISVQPQLVAGAYNELADALSRFDAKTIANWCPHW
jgi:hypothetical protein